MGFEPDPETVIETGRPWTLAVNRNQNLLGKSMLVLDRPCEAVVDLRATEWVELHYQIRRLTAALAAVFEPDLFNYAFLMNVDAQVHLHVIPRYSTTRQWHGQDFSDANWGSSFDHRQEPLAPTQLRAMADQIADALRQLDPGSDQEHRIG